MKNLIVNMTRLIAAILFSLLSACTNLPDRDPQPESGSHSPTLAVDQAHQLKRKGNWSQAIAILKEANDQYPENQAIHAELKSLESAWRNEKRLLEDRILVTETVGLIEKTRLLEKLSHGESDNVLYRSRLLFWQKYLQARADALVACGIHHVQSRLWLAKQCLELADDIAPSVETTALLNDTLQRIKKLKVDSKNRKKMQQARVRKRDVRNLVEEAEKAIQRGAYADAMLKLDQAFEQDPDNTEVRRLLSETQGTLNQHVRMLVQQGDRLYREEQIVPAVAIWEAALKLDPNQEEIGKKIDRARHVLEKLEAIRARE